MTGGAADDGSDDRGSDGAGSDGRDSDGAGSDDPAVGDADPHGGTDREADADGDDSPRDYAEKYAHLEPDPGGRWPDPERELPPTVDPTDPDADVDADTESVPGGLLVTFWGLVAVFDAALLAVSVGAYMLAFGVRPALGWRVLAVGVTLGGYGYYRYRTSPYRDRSGDGGSGPGDGGRDDGGDGPDGDTDPASPPTDDD